MIRLFAGIICFGWLSFSAGLLWAGGSGLNVAIVVNQSSSDSVQLGNYFREQRQVPPQNYLRINWTGINTEWALADFNQTLLTPLLAMLAERQLTNQIDYVVLSMDIPYRVNGGTNGENSTTSALYYGFKADGRDPFSCPLADNSTNDYVGSEDLFRSMPPVSAGGNSFLVTMITASNLAMAKQIVDQGVGSDGTFPTQTVVLAKGADAVRNVRYAGFDNALFNTRLRGNYSMIRTNTSSTAFTNALGCQIGAVTFSVPPNAFVPGAMADNLTSFGGMLFENTGQTTLLSFMQAGASGSYGTVLEPCNYPQKFPDPQNYFYQARGFSLAECYYQSVTNPYEGLVVGEPLAAPFAQPAAGAWTGWPGNAILSGTTNLALQFNASDGLHPVQQVDLFLDGVWLHTITNITPCPGNVLSVAINGSTTSYTVPSGAGIDTVAAGLAGALNASTRPTSTEVQAIVHGDRIELQSTDPTKTGGELSLSTDNGGSIGPLTTFVYASRSNFLDTIAWGIQSLEVATNGLGGNLEVGDYVQLAITKTNGTAITFAVTNSVASSSVAQLIQQLLDLVNANPSLQGPDGLAAEDYVISPDGTQAQFNLRALTEGYAAAQIQADLTCSSNLVVAPTGPATLTANLTDLEPRNHLYVAAGVTNLLLSFPLNTAVLPDGWHELAAVAYEGTHVHTQARATQTVLIQNTSFSASLTTLAGGANTPLGATLQFTVTANTNAVVEIQLFSTGGLIAAATNQATVTFSVATTDLDLGLHPFYAVVTSGAGRQYRTATTWIRIVAPEAPLFLQITAPPPTLFWPAIVRRSYAVLSTPSLNTPFQLRATVVPTNSPARWIDTNSGPAEQFYRVSDFTLNFSGSLPEKYTFVVADRTICGIYRVVKSE